MTERLLPPNWRYPERDEKAYFVGCQDPSGKGELVTYVGLAQGAPSTPLGIIVMEVLLQDQTVGVSGDELMNVECPVPNLFTAEQVAEEVNRYSEPLLT